MKIVACCAYFTNSLVEGIVADLLRWDVDVRLWALESICPALAAYTRGAGLKGRSAALNGLLREVGDAELILLVDDDVSLGASFVPRYTRIVRAIGAAVAQPALSADSYHTHPITIQRPGRWARVTTFVEIGPVVSMTPEFLGLAGLLPCGSAMGWGGDLLWAKISQERGLRQVIVDACPVQHSFRPVASRYSQRCEAAAMSTYLSEHGLCPHPHNTLREYLMLFQDPKEYMRLFPSPREAIEHGASTDMEFDLPLLWAVASLVRPELIVELGTRWGTSTRTLAHAAAQWGGKVVTVDIVDSRPHLENVVCEPLQLPAEDLFRTWTTSVKMLLIDTDPHTYEQTRGWLDTWVKRHLANGGVAVFHDICPARPEIRVAEAVRDWLREQPPIWRWQECPGSNGLGLLWRVKDRPDFEGLLEDLPTE